MANFINRIFKNYKNENYTQDTPDERWLKVQKKLSESKKIIDLGCGAVPIKGADTAVDFYIEPQERSFGFGSKIDINKLNERGIKFINSRIDSTLPFLDKEFDFAYSSHVFEHLDDPATACREMMRIAKSGVIITPYIFADICFGRPYHKWLMMEHDNKLLFFKKRAFEDRPFGEHPTLSKNKKTWIANPGTNPFDILLNDGNWYGGKENMPRLSNTLRKHWYNHSPLIEVIFLWEEKFDFEIYP